MKKILAPKYQYYILPLTYVNICVVAAFNYMLWRNTKKAISTLFLGFSISAICFLFIPYLLSIIGLLEILEGAMLIIYFYIISTLSGIYFIKDQQRYIDSVKF